MRDKLEGVTRHRDHLGTGNDDLAHVEAERLRAREFEFLAEHVVADETYRLDTADLDYLELLDTTWPTRWGSRRPT